MAKAEPPKEQSNKVEQQPSLHYDDQGEDNKKNEQPKTFFNQLIEAITPAPL